MTSDDVLAYMASRPKKNRPTELRSEARMLAAWLRMRLNEAFHDDVIIRHGLNRCHKIDETNLTHDHAIGNAWGHCVRAVVEFAAFPTG